MTIKLLITLAAMAMSIVVCQSEPKKSKPMETSNEKPTQPTEKVEKTDAEWKAQLTAEQYRVARKSGTEAANGEVYLQFKAQGAGTYFCVGCNAELFSSNEKFDSRCGWPSFYDPSKAKNVTTKDDYSAGSLRTEVNCAKCDAHLGHVFKGEGFSTPTDKRFCINGIVLKFVADKEKK
jgi:peptide-methionine (R)-S-oxide reductase